MISFVTDQDEKAIRVSVNLNMATLALEEYGAHTLDCGVYSRKKTKVCTCGLDKMIVHLHELSKEAINVWIILSQ